MLVAVIVAAIFLILSIWVWVYIFLWSEKLKRTDRELSARLSEQDYILNRNRYNNLNKSIADNEQREKVLSKKENIVREKEANLETIIQNRMAKKAVDVSSRPYFSDSFAFRSLSAPDSLENPRVLRALNEKASLSYPLRVSTKITGKEGTYHVTLSSCTCADFTLHLQPCKHMFRLALELGALMQISGGDRSQFLHTYEEKKEACEAAAAESKKSLSSLERKQKFCLKQQATVNALLSETSQQYPWFSSLMAEFYQTYDKNVLKDLQGRAPKAAKELKPLLHKEFRRLRLSLGLAEHQLAVYESLFPWLCDFKELSPSDAVAAATIPENTQYSPDERTDYIRWISDAEYFSLTDAQKYQLALDRWRKRKRTSWDAGIEYERYVGYRYEMDGYHVTYFGATMKKADMGRDIIARKGSLVHIIQCKRYRDERVIHENVIFQLYGSCVEYLVDHPDVQVVPVICTTTVLSDVASRCAEYLKIKVQERYAFNSEYPVIKCNIGKSNHKIYHLPIDQQYDHVLINLSAGESYVSTVAEAERLGFRRAYRWHDKKS